MFVIKIAQKNRAKKFRYFFSCLFITTCFCARAEIREISSISQVHTALFKSDATTLVVFDIDDTLIASCENMFHILNKHYNHFDQSDTAFAKQLYHNLEEASQTKKDPYYLNKFASVVYAQSDFIPVEHKTVEIIKELKRRNIKVIALTASNAGRFFCIENNQKLRFSNLNQVGLNLSGSFDIQEAEFRMFAMRFGFYPVYYKGIICAAGNPKGKVLAAFLDKVCWRPDTIIFFDDGYHHCTSVDSEMKKLGIPVQCYWYKGAYTKKIKLNQSVVRYQVDSFVKHGTFIRESDVLHLISNKYFNCCDCLVKL